MAAPRVNFSAQLSSFRTHQKQNQSQSRFLISNISFHLQLTPQETSDKLVTGHCYKLTQRTRTHKHTSERTSEGLIIEADVSGTIKHNSWLHLVFRVYHNIFVNISSTSAFISCRAQCSSNMQHIQRSDTVNRRAVNTKQACVGASTCAHQHSNTTCALRYTATLD